MKCKLLNNFKIIWTVTGIILKWNWSNFKTESIIQSQILYCCFIVIQHCRYIYFATAYKKRPWSLLLPTSQLTLNATSMPIPAGGASTGWGRYMDFARQGFMLFLSTVIDRASWLQIWPPNAWRLVFFLLVCGWGYRALNLPLLEFSALEVGWGAGDASVTTHYILPEVI